MHQLQDSEHHLNGDFEMRQKNHQMMKMSRIKVIEEQSLPTFKPDVASIDLPNYLSPDKR